MKNAVIAALVVALGVSIVAGVIALATRTTNVEVRVSQDADEPGAPSPAPRPDDGSAPPSPSCAEEALAAACVVLLAARDTLAGDGALNWSADAPLTEWDGVTVSGTPRRVTGLDLRNRGLTGTIPPGLGSLPPTLATVYLAGNAFTGCVPERLRLAENDLDALTAERRIWYCPVPDAPWGAALAAGTWTYDGAVIIDIPADGPRVQLSGIEHWEGEDGGGHGYCLSDMADVEKLCLSVGAAGVVASQGPYGAGGGADRGAVAPAGLDDVFDQIAATARLTPPPSCWEESLAPDCAILLAARDVLAGDGALNWSADVPVEDWVGVTVFGTPRRVRWLHLGRYGLTGTIPPELGNLALRELWLAGNDFTGCIPNALWMVSVKDIASLELPLCTAPMTMPDGVFGEGTYRFPDYPVLLHVPEGLALERYAFVISEPDGRRGCTLVRYLKEKTTGSVVGYDVETARECDRTLLSADGGLSRAAVNELFNQMTRSARVDP